MNRLTILFEAADESVQNPTRQWVEEYRACSESGSFDVGLFDLRSFLQGHGLSGDSSQPQPTPTILRCSPMGEEAYTRLLEELRPWGYWLVTVPARAYWFFFRGCTGLPASRYVIPFKLPGDVFGLGGPDGTVTYVVRDLDVADVELSVAGDADPAKADELAQLFARTKGLHCTGHIFFERQVELQKRDGCPVGWRIFYCNTLPFYGAPLSKAALRDPTFPQPPQEAVDAFRYVSMSYFYAVDLVLTREYGWKCSRLFDGQMTCLPAGAIPRNFYRELARMVCDYAVLWDPHD